MCSLRERSKNCRLVEESVKAEAHARSAPAGGAEKVKSVDSMG